MHKGVNVLPAFAALIPALASPLAAQWQLGTWSAGFDHANNQSLYTPPPAPPEVKLCFPAWNLSSGYILQAIHMSLIEPARVSRRLGYVSAATAAVISCC